MEAVQVKAAQQVWEKIADSREYFAGLPGPAPALVAKFVRQPAHPRTPHTCGLKSKDRAQGLKPRSIEGAYGALSLRSPMLEPRKRRFVWKHGPLWPVNTGDSMDRALAP